MTNENYIPYCIEPSLGVDRVVLAFLCNAYEEQELEGGDVRTVLHLHPALAPFKAAVLPLQKNKLGALASGSLREAVPSSFMVDYDETGSIGKRYRRQDEIGTPFCICVDFDTEATGSRYHPRPRHHAAGARGAEGSAELHRGADALLISPVSLINTRALYAAASNSIARKGVQRVEDPLAGSRGSAPCASPLYGKE